MDKFLPLILISAGGIILTIGDIIMKRWVFKGGTIIYILGLLVYTVAMIFLSQSYKFKNIAVASLMFVLFNIITLLIVSWFLYQEKLSLIQFIGVFFGLMSIVILEME